MIDPDRIIVALDTADHKSALALVSPLRAEGLTWFKVGLASWIHGGRPLVTSLQEMGCKVFLDLKLHDIPHQVSLATRAVADLGVDLLTVHASGGSEMLKASVEAAGRKTRILAVTVLTSLDAAPGQVAHRAIMAAESGVHGIVCSPLELGEVRPRLAAPFLLVTPGIRPAGLQSQDQKRVATPRAAMDGGADFLVIGRAITGATDPAQAARAIIQS